MNNNKLSDLEIVLITIEFCQSTVDGKTSVSELNDICIDALNRLGYSVKTMYDIKLKETRYIVSKQ
ncbi:hypothetical protein [Elizabethkingia anophelis]|uniref:hypothetical protein n=1 Tax=Elizabethkingia anophelis TaxID=1117645 RepID=UPI000750A479|nr:hypothetical protein [Elizabethkingia anophelis]AQW91304.1 hypothetical protein BBD28_11850 [Elizabethkingia anophelis]KUY14170.1 hypothetical protein ATB94_09230 [Elizabethkingia anophelis]